MCIRDRFKEAAEAYDVLSNPEKRARYDQFGHAGMSGAAGAGGGFGGFGGGFSMEDIFSQFGDIFGGHFSGGSYRTSSSGGRRVSRGTDIRVRVKLTLAEIAAGTVKKLKINKQIACPKCGGTGAKDANSYSTCSTCNGAGYVNRVENTFFGRMQTQSVCPTCGGTGKVITNPCDECKGEGTIKGSEVVEIRIPAGVGDGMAVSYTHLHPIYVPVRIPGSGIGEFGAAPVPQPNDRHRGRAVDRRRSFDLFVAPAQYLSLIHI